MTPAQRYPVRTVIDIARIPPEAIQRFAAELPAMHAMLHSLVALYDAAREQGADVPDTAYDELLAHCDWIDDDAKTMDVTIEVEANGLRFASDHHFTITPEGFE